MKRGKDALFAWCKAVTAGYRGVEIKDFHMSWRDGLAFCAIIHRYRPDLINFNSLNKDEPLKNHELAFSVAEGLGIPPLLDPEDMLVAPTPEPLSVMTYLSQFFHYFSGQKGAGIAVISHTEDTSPSAFAFSRPDANNSTPAPAAGPAKTSTTTNNTAPPRTTSNAPPPSRDTRTESAATRPTATPAIPKINTSLTKPEVPVGSKSPRLSHGGSIAETEAPVCQKCSKQVSGQTIEWQGNLYHKECFGCTTCNKQFRNNCLNIDGKPYCEGCGRKAFIASKLAKRGGDSNTTTSTATTSTSTSSNTSTAPASKPSTTVDNRAASSSVSTSVPPRSVSGSVSTVPRTGSNVGSSTTTPNRPLNIIEQEALREQEREKERELERQRLSGKSVSDAERKKREEEERKKREDEEKRKREEEDRKKRETEEKRKREEEEKRKTLEDERRKREEEERKKRDEENKRKTLEDERRKREEEERKKREEDERKRREEQDRKRREDEERRRTQENDAAKRREEERKRALDEDKRVQEEARKRRALEEEENRKQAQLEEDKRRKTLEEETRRREESTAARPRFVTASQATPEQPQNEANKVLQAIEEARRKKKAEEEEKRRQREEQRLKAAEDEQRRRAETIRRREEEKNKRDEEERLKRELDEVKRATSGSVISPRKQTTSEPDLQRKAREEEEENERIKKQLELKNQEIMRLNEENEREAARLRERRLSRNTSRNTSKSSGSFEREKAEQDPIEAAIQARKQSELKPVLGRWGDSTSTDSSVPEWQVRAKSVQEKYRTNSELPNVNNNYSNASNNNNSQDMNYYKAQKYSNDLDEEFDRKINKRQTRVRNFVWEDFLESNKLKGFMMKRDPNGIFGGKWRRRYFVLREARLLYYRQEPPASSVGMNHPPLGIISLQYSSAIEPEGNGKIKIVTPDRVWRLDAGNNQEREKWIKGLKEAKEIYGLVKNKIDEQNVPIYGPNYEARKEGVLQRYNAIYIWVENYFTLQDGILFYFASKGANQKGRVPLYDAKFEEYATKYSFKIVWKENGKKNEIILAAKNDEEMQSWCTALLKQKLLIEDTINSIEF